MQTKTKILLGIGLIGLIGYVVVYRKKNTQAQSENKPQSDDVFPPFEEIVKLVKNKDKKVVLTPTEIAKRRKACIMKKGEWIDNICINLPVPKSTLNQQDTTAHLGSRPTTSIQNTYKGRTRLPGNEYISF